MNWEEKNNIPFRIEKDIPINFGCQKRESLKYRKIKKLLGEMEFGESFFVPDLPFISKKDHVSKPLVNRVVRGMGLKFVSRMDEVNGVLGRRYWKVEL